MPLCQSSDQRSMLLGNSVYTDDQPIDAAVSSLLKRGWDVLLAPEPALILLSSVAMDTVLLWALAQALSFNKGADASAARICDLARLIEPLSTVAR